MTHEGPPAPIGSDGAGSVGETADRQVYLTQNFRTGLRGPVLRLLVRR